MVLCLLAVLGIIGRQHAEVICNLKKLSKEDTEVAVNTNSEPFVKRGPEVNNGDDLPFHPFENSCKFAMPNTYASDVEGYRVAERMRKFQCPYEDFDLATMDSEGYMYVHPHFTHYPDITIDVECYVVFLEGALRNKTTDLGKDDFKEVATVQAPENTRFLANGDAFYIRCKKDGKQIFQQVYAGMRDLERDPNKLYLVDDMESFDNYGRRTQFNTIQQTPSRYSIDILGFDSTSRTMFMRHLPRTMETMNKLGYELFYGYTKVGDNSMVNLAPVLAGDVPSALVEPKLDGSGDINVNWILPNYKKLDPTEIPFLWKMMEKEFGCRSMFNEDISMKSLGLFHYPPDEFLPGFTSPPADHFYRTYYLAVYKNWTYSQCKDGDQIQRQFVDLWRRFANKYKDICHFGFTFVTTLTHEAGFMLETLDEQISTSLQNLYFTGALDKGISVIMGDHGNRIGLVQFSYTGRIEERMPLMAIRLPPEFKKMYPKEYSNFLVNKWKLTSNFDIHQTLKDIALMRFGSARKSNTTNYGRGISLFDEIPSNRQCFDAFIPENFCTCLVDRSSLLSPGVNENTYYEAIKHWMDENDLNGCLNSKDMKTIGNASIMGLNALARHGLRSKRNVTLVELTRKKNPRMDFLYHEVVVRMQLLANHKSIELLFRIEESVKTAEFRVVFEPQLRDPLLVDCPTILGATAAIRRVYLPANDFSKITESYESPRGNNRIFDFSDTNFSLVLSPSPACTTHEVLLSFFDTWIPGDALEKTQLYQRAFVLELREKWTKESAFDGFYYNVFTHLQGKTVEMKSVWISPEYSVVRFSLSKKGTYIKSAEDESPVIKLDTNTSKYFALFSSKREHCSTFISQVDENFKIWTRDDPINVKGLPPKRPQRNNVLSAVIIALLFILFYYMFLEKVALPLYFHFKMPLPAVRRRMMKSHSPKKITFDVNLTVEEDAQDKSEPTTPTPLHTSGEAIKNTSAELSKPSTSGSKSTSMDKTQKNTKEKAKKEV